MKYQQKWMIYNRGIKEFERLLSNPNRTWTTKVMWYSGSTGTGKTRLAHLLTKGNAWVAPDISFQWFDGYSGQESVIVDDIGPSEGQHPPRNVWLRMTDRYPMQVPVKGGFVDWVPKRIFVTSNFTPEDVFHSDRACLRRVSEHLTIN